MKTNSVETSGDLTELFRQGVPGIVHDHMHWENGVLVEDTPAVESVPSDSVDYRLRAEAFQCMSDADLRDQALVDLVMSLTKKQTDDEPPVLTKEEQNIRAVAGALVARRLQEEN